VGRAPFEERSQKKWDLPRELIVSTYAEGVKKAIE
jgi:hypothetical protein